MKKRWKAHVRNGVLCIQDQQAFQDHLSTLKGEIAVTIETWKRPTSSPQLAYYYGVVVKLLSEFTGFTKDEMDLVLKNMFLSEYVEVHSWVFRKPLGKKAVSTTRFETFLEDCRQWAQNTFDMYIPTPNEVDFQETLCPTTPATMTL